MCPIITPAQEVLESLKDRWFQADSPPADQVLNEEEFLSFLHPEHSRGMLQYMVKEIVRDLGTSLKKNPEGNHFYLFIYLTFTNSNIIYYGLHIKKKQTSYLNIFFFYPPKIFILYFVFFLTIFLFCCVSLAPFIYLFFIFILTSVFLL